MKKLRPYFVGVYYSLPVQLLLLHFKRYQILLLFWYILFATINGSFMLHFGANMLFLSPEYLGYVNALSLALVGAAVAVFIMSWNITTFILHADHLRFLATTTQPFLKYCINNAIIPIAFLCFYFFKSLQFTLYQELLPAKEIIILIAGFLAGFFIAISIAFTYFFSADRTLFRLMPQTTKDELLKHKHKYQSAGARKRRKVLHIDWYLSATLALRRPRSVKHYSQEFIDSLFKQHHLVALFSILIAIISLTVSGYFLDNIYFQLPAAASVTVFFAILIAVAGAFSYFLRAWSFLLLLVLIAGVNILYQHGVLDPRNKAYGLDYTSSNKKPVYSQQALNDACNTKAVQEDSLTYIQILNSWKKRQAEEKPTFVIASVSGGGTRASAFTMNVLRQLEGDSKNFTPQLFMITGASGGMIGAAWFRELYLRKQQQEISDSIYKAFADDVTGDLLNPLFSSFIARDVLAPPQRFTYEGQRYLKDRGYAFEEKLNINTHGFLNRSIKDYRSVEDSALVPRLFFNSVITRDGRKLVISTRPSRFMMKPLTKNNFDNGTDADAIDFTSFFSAQQSQNLRVLTALRMNATFPYALPNVWLPTEPVIDVMDAGFRDNTGVETALKFLYYFREWLTQNCSKIILVQISDKPQGGWDNPFESKNILDLVTKPALLTQTNLFRFQEYSQLTQIEWFHSILDSSFHRVLFAYTPTNKQAAASLSFHLTQREKLDLKAALNNAANKASFSSMHQLLNTEITKAQ